MSTNAGGTSVSAPASSAASAPASGSGSGLSKKDEERRKQFVTGVLGLPVGVLGSSPIVGTMAAKYVKMAGHEDKSAFQLDLLRMLAIARGSAVDQ